MNGFYIMCVVYIAIIFTAVGCTIVFHNISTHGIATLDDAIKEATDVTANLEEKGL